jgi:phage gpG-like protein
MQITIKTDTMTPQLQQILARIKDSQSVMREVGTALAAMTRKAFTNPEMRPSTWPGNATLVRSGTLSRSPRLIEAGPSHALIGSDREYAAAHQLGSKPHVIEAKNKKALFWKGASHPVKSVNHPGLPPRPFFPFHASGKATDTARLRVKEILLRWLKP